MGRRALSRLFICPEFSGQRLWDHRWDILPKQWYHSTMTKLEQIEKSITELSPEELKAFAAWFEALRADMWDRQIEVDAKSGRLDKLAQQALTDHRAGRTRSL